MDGEEEEESGATWRESSGLVAMALADGAGSNSSSQQFPSVDPENALSSPALNAQDSSRLAEIYFLIADFLRRNSPCQHAANVLIAELSAFGLLQHTVDWRGVRRPATYQDFHLRHSNLPRNHLIQLFESLQASASTNSPTSRPNRSPPAPPQTINGTANGGVSNLANGTASGTNALSELTANTANIDNAVAGVADPVVSTLDTSAAAVRDDRGAIVASPRSKAREAGGFFSWLHTPPRTKETATASMSADAKRQLAKELVRHLFLVRNAIRSRLRIEKVIGKYESFQRFHQMDQSTQPSSQLVDPQGAQQMQQLLMHQVQVEQELHQLHQQQQVHHQQQQMHHQPDIPVKPEFEMPVAADPRALKQLLELREQETSYRQRLSTLTIQAQQTGLFRSRRRMGRNQVFALGRREMGAKLPQDRDPLPFVYSRFRQLKTLSGHLFIPAYCLVYDKRRSHVITGADDRLIKIWCLNTGILRFTLRGHVGNITDLAVNNDNTLLASSSDDKTTRIWELETGFPIAVLTGHTSIVNTVRFHPTRNMVVTASDDGKCYCYLLPEIKEAAGPETIRQTLERLHNQRAYSLSLRPHYSLCHGATARNVRSCKVLCLSFSRCGKYLVTGGQDCIGKVWDISFFLDPSNPLATYTSPPSTNELPAVEAPQRLPPRLELPPREAPAPMQTEQGMDIQTEVQAPELPSQPEEPQGSDLLGDIADRQAENDSAQSDAPLTRDENLVQNAVQRTIPDPIPTAIAPPPVPTQDVTVRGRPRRLERSPPRDATPETTAPPDESIPSCSEPAGYLKGHTGPITNLVFSNAGTRIATASIKDGTARIWSWEKKFKKITQVVLPAEEEEDEYRASLLLMEGVRRRITIPSVDTIMWTRNDERLITMHSTKPGVESAHADWRQRIRVWDPANGRLLMTLGAIDKEKQNGHTNAAFALDVHPTDWRIIVTGGYDGRIFLWDISSGRMLKRFVNIDTKNSVGDAMIILDGGFTPNGDMFCFTDRGGNLRIFGTGSGEQFNATPIEQYFKNDYAQLEQDTFMNVRDLATHLQPNLMPSGPLVDSRRDEYAQQPPHLLRLTKPMTSRLYEAHRRLRVKQAHEYAAMWNYPDKREEGEPDEENFPLAICVVKKKVDPNAFGGLAAIPQHASMAYRLNGDPVLRAEIARRRARTLASTRRRRSSPVDERDTSILNLEISSDDDQDEDFQESGHVGEHDDDDDDDDEDEDEDDEIDEEDLELSDSPTHYSARRNHARYDSPLQTRRTRLRRSTGSQESSEDDRDDPISNMRSLRRRQTRTSSFPRRGGRRLVESSDEEADIAQEREAGDADSSSANGTHSSQSQDNTRETSMIIESNDGVIIGNNQLDRFDTSVTYAEILETRRQSRGSASQNEALIVCAFCNQGDCGGMLTLPGEIMGVHPLISGNQRLFVHDQCAIASPLCFHRGGRWYNVSKEIRRGRSLHCFACKTRGATIGCHVASCEVTYHWKCALSAGFEVNTIHFYCVEHRASHQEGGSPEEFAGDGDEEHPTKRFGLIYHREWLQRVNLSSTQQYVPQLGDHVVYFPKGHAPYLRMFAKKAPSCFRHLAKYPVIKCQVIDIKYRFPLAEDYSQISTIKTELVLAVLAVPSSSFRVQNGHDEEKIDDDARGGTIRFDGSLFNDFQSVDSEFCQAIEHVCERFTFSIHYHAHDLSNFLVLDHVYNNGVEGGWAVGDMVSVPFVQMDDHGFETGCRSATGVIQAIKTNADRNSADCSPWECIQVRFDDDDIEDCLVSPWELGFVDEQRIAAKRREDDLREANRFFRSRNITHAQRISLLQAIDGIMSLSIARDFNEPVDPAGFADYYITVANPIDLSMIKKRVTQGYYRQIEALVCDVNLLGSNCLRYNVDTSPIAQNARSICNALNSAIQHLFPSQHSVIRQTEPVRDLPFPPYTLEDLAAIPPSSPISDHSQPGLTPIDHQEVISSDHGLPIRTIMSRASDSSRSGASSRAESPQPDTNTSIDVKDEFQGQSEVAVKQEATLRPSGQNAVTTPASAARMNRKRGRSGSGDTGYYQFLRQLSEVQREQFHELCRDDLQGVLEKLHKLLMEGDKQRIFAEPVTDEIAPGYSQIIRNPMDFGTMADQLESYTDFAHYLSHLQLVFQNALKYNGEESFVNQEAVRLQANLMKYMVRVLNQSSKRQQQQRRSVSAPKFISATRAARRSVPPPTKRNRVEPHGYLDDADDDSWNSASESDSASAPSDSGSDDDEAIDDYFSEDSDEEDDDEDEDDEDFGVRTRRAPRRAASQKNTRKKKPSKASKVSKKRKRSAKKSRY